MTSRKKTTLALLRSILGPVTGSESHFAKLTGLSASWLKKASAGICPMTENAAAIIAEATGVSALWLLRNDISRAPVGHDRKPYTRESFDAWKGPVVDDGEPRHDPKSGPAAADRLRDLSSLHSILLALHSADAAGKTGTASFALREFAGHFAERFGESDYKNAAAVKSGKKLCESLMEAVVSDEFTTTVKLRQPARKPEPEPEPVADRIAKGRAAIAEYRKKPPKKAR